MGHSKDKDSIKKLTEQIKTLSAQNEETKKKLAEELAKNDIRLDNVEKDLANSQEAQWKKANEIYEQISEGGVIDPSKIPTTQCGEHEHFDSRVMKCMCDQGYVRDTATGKCVPQPDNPPPPDGTPTYPKDEQGIVKIYKDKEGGKVINSGWEASTFVRNYASGKPSEQSFEYEIKKPLSEAISNGESQAYVKINGFKTNEADTVSYKDGGPDHSDGKGKSWIIYELMTDGSTGKVLEIESPHPSNHGQKIKTQLALGMSIVGKWVGYKWINYELDGGKDRQIEMYLDFPVLDIAKPPNNWRKYYSVKASELDQYGKDIIKQTGGNLLIRIDGVDKNSLPEVKYASKREIIPELSIQVDNPPPPVVIPPPVTNPPSGAGQLLYDSNTDGGWNNGQARTVDKSDGNIQPNGKGLEMHASGSPTLIIDGNGGAILQCKPGHGRAYVFCKNYNGILEEEIMFDANVENHTIQTRSRHQEGGDGPNRFGGLSAKISPVDVGLKIERFHNEHLADQEKKLAKPLQIGQWYKIRYTYNDTADGKGIFQKIDINYGNGFEEIMTQTTTTGIEPYFIDKASFEKNSYFWLRMNNTKDAKLGIRNVRLFAQ